MSKSNRSRRPLAALLAVTVGIASGLLAAPVAIAGEGPPDERHEPARRGFKSPSAVRSPARPSTDSTPTPLSPGTLRERERRLERTHREGPPVPRAPATGSPNSIPDRPLSPPTTPRGGASPRESPRGAATGTTILASVDLFNAVRDLGLSTTLEPSVAVKGQGVLMMGNWFAAWSEDGGDSYSAIDPYDSPFLPPDGQTFCCDQVTIYSARTNSIFWLQQFTAPEGTGNTQRISVDQGADGAFECGFDFYPGDFGLPDDDFIDFPDLQLGDEHLYATTNSFEAGDDGKFDRSVVYRIPLDAIGNCEGFNFEYHSSTDFGPRVAADTGAVGYWATHAYGAMGAQFLRVATWPPGGEVALRDVPISLPAGAQYGDYSCPGPDGTDMCAFSGNRLLGAYRIGDELGFLWNEPQGGPYPFPYVATARIRAGAGTLIAQAAIWNENFAWSYPSSAPNSNGRVGGTMAYGGGARNPSCAAWTANGDLDATFDAITVVVGNAGPASNRWGDYLTSRRNPDRTDTWNGTCYALFDGQTAGSSHPIFLHFAAGGDSKGTTLTPDQLTFLVNKDVGDQRWAISLNTVDFGGEPVALSATGNVYFPGGGDPQFVYCEPNPASQGTVTDPASVFRFACWGTGACPGTALDCAAFSWDLIDPDVELAAAFFLPPGGYDGVSSLVVAPSEGGSRAVLAGSSNPLAARREAARVGSPLADGRGSTLTPDLLHFLTSKDVGDQRWAISLSYVDLGDFYDLQDVTGNVYFPDGSPPQFVYCTPRPGQTGTVDDPSSIFSFACWGADACTSSALECADDTWTLINPQVNLAASFFLPPGGL